MWPLRVTPSTIVAPVSHQRRPFPAIADRRYDTAVGGRHEPPTILAATIKLPPTSTGQRSPGAASTRTRARAPRPRSATRSCCIGRPNPGSASSSAVCRARSQNQQVLDLAAKVDKAQTPEMEQIGRLAAELRQTRTRRRRHVRQRLRPHVVADDDRPPHRCNHHVRHRTHWRYQPRSQGPRAEDHQRPAGRNRPDAHHGQPELTSVRKARLLLMLDCAAV